MRIYLDDNAADPKLAGVLRKAGHEVVMPSEIGNSGISDPRHLAFAIREGYLILTQDQKDFTELHELVIASGGGHPGVLIVRNDNDATRDLSTRGIATAIRKLGASGLPLTGQVHILNHWR